jgi:hypothetical protein
VTATRGDTRADGTRLAEGLIQGKKPPWWWLLVQVAALGFHVPLSVLSGSQRALASVSGAIFVGTAVTASLLLLYWLARRFIPSGWSALAVTSALAVSFWHSRSIDIPGPLGWAVSLLIAGLIIAAAYKYSEQRLFKVASFVGSATLAGTLLLLIAVDTMSTPESVVTAQNPIGSVSLTSTPDLYLIVLDGYGRADVMADRYQHDNSDFLAELEARHFQVANASSSNYTITHLALPSLLNMSYMSKPFDYMHNSDLVRLARITSGDNRMVQILKDHGYTYVHGDSDHWFNTCGEAVDICFPGPILDVTSHALLSETPVGGLIYPTSGDPTTALNRLRINQMTSWSESRPEVDGPLFVFLHLVLPHPPLFLDSNCEVRIDDRLDGRLLNDGTFEANEIDVRKEGWVEQVRCANKTVLEFLDQLGEDAVVVITSDHGPDSAFIIDTSDPRDLTPDRLGERLPNLTSVRLPGSCDDALPEDIHTVNLMRVVLGCLSDQQIAHLDDQYFAATFGGSIVELDYSNADAR